MHRTVAVVLALLAVPLAGCFSNDSPTPAADTSTRPTLPALANGTYVTGKNVSSLAPEVGVLLASATGGAVYTGFKTFEPTVGAASTGALFMSGSASLTRSLDGGATWDEVVPKFPGGAGPAFDNDPYIYVDPTTDRVFVDVNQLAACTVLFWSDDFGKTWSGNPAACPLPVNDHQTMVAAKPRGTPTVGYPNLLVMCVNAVVTTNCARSLDGGQTFHPLPPAFVAVKDGCNASLGHLAASPDGILYLPKGNCGLPTVFVSKDDGLTWTQSTVSDKVRMNGGQGSHEVRVAVDEAGNVYAFWQGEDGLPYLSTSTDEGATWSKTRMVGFDGLTGMDFPAIAAGGPGKVAFAYVGTTFPEPYEQPIAEGLTPQTAVPANVPGMAWHGYIGVLTDALDENGTILTVTSGDPSDPLVRGACGRTRCPGVGDFIAITIGPDGRPWAAFGDACVEACAKPDGTENTYSRAGGVSGDGVFGTLASGPALRGNATSLPPLPVPGAASRGETGEDPPSTSLASILRRAFGL